VRNFPYLCKPQADEIFSSWFFRLAKGNSTDANRFAHYLIKNGSLFTQDCDLQLPERWTNILAEKLEIPDHVIRSSSLLSLVGNYIDEINLNGHNREILTGGTRGLNRTLELVEMLDRLSAATRFSTSRYLQLFLQLLNGSDSKALSLFDDIIAHPQNPPKIKDMSDEFGNRDETIRQYFFNLRDALLDCNGKLIPIEARMDIIKQINVSFKFITFSDFLEFEHVMQKALYEVA
jgi:hypothetical protein